MTLKKIKLKDYFFKVEENPEEVTKRLKESFLDYAVYRAVDERENLLGRTRLGGPVSFSVLHKWEFPENLLRFNLSYFLSSPGSFMSGYDYKDIQGNLIYTENLEQSTLEQVDSLLEKSGLSACGQVREVLLCTGIKVDSLQGLVRLIPKPFFDQL